MKENRKKKQIKKKREKEKMIILYFDILNEYVSNSNGYSHLDHYKTVPIIQKCPCNTKISL